ncbi:hypothetical protein [Bradyrhizobium sp. WYCCWR 12699]|uniref:hypothetical protein n=1 Tax=Bradyrhizobium sp. WYCCWR 12699 TaxID=3064203 RepID=UPI0028A2E231|nr:hypothetical protein [Bradyrhizobium sp. WYCCWR 12699]MDT4737227.1 hypothetical protein [Bradyrhizobium sp. WYCCWR 12699]
MGTDRNLRLATEKAQDVTIKKLTRGIRRWRTNLLNSAEWPRRMLNRSACLTRLN